MPRQRKYPPELLDRGARLVFESGRPIAHVARDLGVPSETLRVHVRRVEADEGLRPDLPTAGDGQEIKRLRRENFELRRGERDPEGRFGVFRQGARRRPTEVSRFIDEHRGRFGVEPICRSWACRRPPTTTAPAVPSPRAGSRTSGCWSGSRRSMPPTTTPMAIGAPGRPCCAPARAVAVIASSG